jgi:hypothetical protein
MPFLTSEVKTTNQSFYLRSASTSSAFALSERSDSNGEVEPSKMSEGGKWFI